MSARQELSSRKVVGLPNMWDKAHGPRRGEWRRGQYSTNLPQEDKRAPTKAATADGWGKGERRATKRGATPQGSTRARPCAMQASEVRDRTPPARARHRALPP